MTESLTALLDELATGNRPRAVELTLLSGLDRTAVEELRAAWADLPESARDDVLQRTTELAEDNVDLDFGPVALVALDDPSPAVRRRAIEALWESHDRPTAKRLSRLVAEDMDESVRAAAATALGAFVLLRELDSFDAEAGDAAIAALRARAEDPDESADVRARALEALGPRNLDWIDTLVTDAYYSDDQRLRIAAVRAMGLSAQERWIEYLQEQAASDDPEVRYEIATALGLIASEEGLEPLLDLTEDDDAEVVMAALAALGEVGGEDAVERLKAFAGEGPDELREAARSALETASFLDDSDLMRRGVADDEE